MSEELSGFVSTERDRRRSERWRSEKTITWRVRGGRRLRHGTVPERSLYGLVITAAKLDAAPPGTLVYAADDHTSLRHGFRRGVVCRTNEEADGRCRLCIDILA